PVGKPTGRELSALAGLISSGAEIEKWEVVAVHYCALRASEMVGGLACRENYRPTGCVYDG
ncbi:MAG TPA: hypothetical protein DDW52_18925, partial [Planctomycetaceae bacterium]|nr:hypothetical protein [Planctomycetaceae bacterium]